MVRSNRVTETTPGETKGDKEGSTSRPVRGPRTNTLPRGCPAMARSTFLVATLVLASATSACRGPHVQTLSDEEVRTRATGVVTEEPEVVLPACAKALRDMGYEVAVEDGVSGLVRTRLLPARTGPGREYYSRAYEVRVSTRGTRASTIVATALLFAGPPGTASARDGTTGTRATVWSVAEERTEAARFFAAVRDALGEPPDPRRR